MPNAQVNVGVARDDALSLAIIVPLLNESAVVHSLVQHLSNLKQLNNAADLEVILVDGRSHDGTYQAAKESGFKLVESESGRAKQMNAGAAAANSTMLLFLHADTRLPDDFLSEVQRAEVWGRFDVRFDSSSTTMKVIAAFMNMRSRLTGVATGDQALFISADVFSAIGEFPLIPLMEDIAVCKVLRQLHAPLCSRSQVTTSARRWEQQGVVKTVLRMWWYRLAFFLGVSPKWLARGYYDAR